MINQTFGIYIVRLKEIKINKPAWSVILFTTRKEEINFRVWHILGDTITNYSFKYFYTTLLQKTK